MYYKSDIKRMVNDYVKPAITISLLILGYVLFWGAFDRALDKERVFDTKIIEEYGK